MFWSVLLSFWWRKATSNMAEGCSRSETRTVDILSSSQQENGRNFPANSLSMLGRRPLSDSSIKYEENAFHDSSEVKLVHFAERRNSFSTQGSSDGGNSSDDGLKASTSRGPKAPEQSFRIRSRKGTKPAFHCDCPQSQKSKRKAARKLSTLTTSSGLPFPVLPVETKSRPRKTEGSFMKRVKKLFCDSGSPTNCDELRFPYGTSASSKSTKAINEAEQSRCTKKDIQKKERHYIIADILAVTNCSYYWGSINRHEAEEVSIGQTINLYFRFHRCSVYICCFILVYLTLWVCGFKLAMFLGNLLYF